VVTVAEPFAATAAQRILDQIEAAYNRQAPQAEIDALWDRYHAKERAVLWLLGGLQPMYRTLDRLAEARRLGLPMLEDNHA
jgi:hypothetical protein